MVYVVVLLIVGFPRGVRFSHFTQILYANLLKLKFTTVISYWSTVISHWSLVTPVPCLSPSGAPLINIVYRKDVRYFLPIA
jgi:hypothetical protein